MAQERLKSPRARLFVALDLPEPVRRGIVAWQATALDHPRLRPVAPEALHVTLCFLGYRPEREIDPIAGLLGGLRAAPVHMRLDAEPVRLPPRRPRLLAVGARSDAAVELQLRLAAELERQGFHRPEKRPFWPHVTVARVRSQRGAGRRSGRRDEPAAGPDLPARPLPARLLQPFGAVRATLYRSTLRPSGAEYASLASIDLPPGRGPGGEMVT